LVDSQKALEDRYEQAMERKQHVVGNTKSALERKAKFQKQGQTAGAELKSNMHVFSRSLKQSPLSTDNLEKVQADRYAIFSD
jgi:hypothetical protein